MTGERQADLQYLLDRAAIQDVIVRYFQGLDRGDDEQVRSCFTDDARATSDGAPDDGGALLQAITSFCERLRLGRSPATGDEPLVGATHFMGNFVLTKLSGDMAEAETYAIAFMVRPAGAGDQMAMRGLRYLDRLRRTGDGWRISERRHTLDWSAEVPATFAKTLAERVLIPPRPPRTPHPPGTGAQLNPRLLDTRSAP